MGQAIAWFTMQGYVVSLPLTDSQDYDLVVEVDGVLKKVQVKTGTKISSSGTGIFYMAVTGGNRSGATKSKTVKSQVWDYFFGYHLGTDQIIFVPKEKIDGQNQLNLGEKYAMWTYKVNGFENSA